MFARTELLQGPLVVTQQHVRFLFSCAVVFGTSSWFCAVWLVYHFACQPLRVGAAVFDACWVLAYWSYLRMVLTDPGTPRSPEWEAWRAEFVEEVQACETDQDAEDDLHRRGWTTDSMTTCGRCSRARPARAHHCGACGACVLRMDHHCPWAANCVGWRNHKYFLLLCGWVCVACVVCLLTMRSPTAFEAVGFGDPQSSPALAAAGPVMVTLLVLIVCITGFLFWRGVDLAMQNCTTLEVLFRGENPYSLSSRAANLTQLLGPLDPWMLLPVPPSRRLRGTTFPLGSTEEEEEEECAPAE